MDEKKIIAICDKLADKAFSQKKINVRELSEVQGIVKIICDHIDYFNSLATDTCMIADHQLSDWVILNEFADFIYPNSIRYESGNRIYVDLLDRTQVKGFKPDYQKYLMALSRFRGLFKRDALSEITNLANLRMDKSFEEVRARICVNCSAANVVTKSKDKSSELVRYLDIPFYPIPVKGLFNFVDASIYFTASKTDIINDYISNMKFI